MSALLRGSYPNLQSALMRKDEDTTLLQRALQEVLIGWQGEIDIILNPTQTSAASITTLSLFEPPSKNTNEEWLLLMVTVEETTETDPSDNVTLKYTTDGGTTYILLGTGTPTDTGAPLNALSWYWPRHSATNEGSPVYPVRLRRKPNDESWLAVQVLYRTTALVGTRNIKFKALIARRPF